jgi:hypothetical protein
MPRVSHGGRRRLARFLVPILVATLAPAGCGSGNQAGDVTPASKDASRRQKDMQDFMKDRQKVNTASKSAPRQHP